MGKQLRLLSFFDKKEQKSPRKVLHPGDEGQKEGRKPKKSPSSG